MDELSTVICARKKGAFACVWVCVVSGHSVPLTAGGNWLSAKLRFNNSAAEKNQVETGLNMRSNFPVIVDNLVALAILALTICGFFLPILSMPSLIRRL